MHFQLSWSDEELRILLVETSGLWDGKDAVAQWNEAIAHEPKYIIWDVTSIIIVPEAYNLPEQDSERHLTLSQLAHTIQQPEFQQFFVVEITDHPIFNVIRETSHVYQMDHKVQLVSSVDAALDMIHKG